MKEELQEASLLREVMNDDDYRFLVAKIAIHNLKESVKRKSEMHRLVNDVLNELNLGSISYGFIRNHVSF
ncbi:hypothetical protein JI666_20365 [Bacillus sp. NTK071]|uniref:hypothetical protein n=1 Tax=Bacillus sp. NTK071 TaxID=2802175 RepID=UPI001A909239|nr:hypothetical protein [Bacillus sp. NTK071]MBN8211093.1 hypothetical protein [Bacillus sp. NTK071]